MHVLSQFSRRKLLGGGAAAAALGPFIPLLDSHAGGDGIPTRLIIVYTPAGTVLPRWRPTGTETDWQLSEILSPLAERKADVIVLDGVDDEAAHHTPGEFHPQGWGYGGHHAICSLWSGVTPLVGSEFSGASITLDQYIGQQLAGLTPFNTLQFGVAHREEEHWKNRISYSGPSAPVAAIGNPVAMLEHIFGDLDLDEAAQLRLKNGRLSVLDSVVGELDALASRTSKSDQIKIEEHLDSIREMELQIRTGVQGCAIPELAGVGGFEGSTADMMDLMVTALACDATRVETLMWSWENSGEDFEWLDLDVPDTRYHGLSHEQNEAAQTAYSLEQQWYVSQFKALLDRLDAVEQADGNTLLDHTAVVWASPTSVSWNHSSRNLPIVIGGRGGGYFTTDRYHRWGDLPGDTNTHLYHGGRTMNDLHLSLLRAMGLDDETFGDPQFCTGPLI